MSRFTLVKFTFILTALAVCIFSSLCATDRINCKRLLQINDSSSGEMGPSSRLTNYYYHPNDPELLDSTRFIVNGLYHSTKYFQGTVVLNGNHRQISHYVYNDAAHTSPYMHLLHERDSQGRIIYNRKKTWNYTSNSYDLVYEIYRHYNTAGYVDSLDYKINNIRYYLKRYFTGNILTNSIVKRYNNGYWLQAERYTYTYPDPLVEYPAFLRFDNFICYTFTDYLEYEKAFNPKFAASSVYQEIWNGTQWQEGNTYTTDDLTLNFPEDYPETGGMIFNDTGDAAEQFSHIADVGESYINYSWGILVPVDDETASVSNNMIIVYPNPFHSTIVIALDSKNPSPSDISIHNLKGQLIRQWKDSRTPDLTWDGCDALRNPVGAGIYFIKAQQGNTISTRKAIKLK
jgi:hypothetical protein